MTVDRLKPGTKAWEARQRRHRHNAFTGHVAMMRANLRSIIAADSVSEGTKYVAQMIFAQTDLLAEGLKTRIDL